MIKKNFLTAVVLCSLATLSLSSCNSNKKENGSDSTNVVSTENSDVQTTKTENAPESYKMTATPDSAILGKSREALIKVKDINVIELKDAEGASTGAELTIKLSVTNKSTIEDKKFFTVSSSDARLQLDDNTSVPTSNSEGDSGPDAESTSEATWTFKMPAGTKAKNLNFFLDGTRVGVTLNAK